MEAQKPLVEYMQVLVRSTKVCGVQETVAIEDGGGWDSLKKTLSVELEKQLSRCGRRFVEGKVKPKSGGPFF